MPNNKYYNESIGFYIEKPDNWDFLPTPWVANIKNKTALSNDEISHLMQQANIPFVYIQKPSTRTDIAYPTVQATCRHMANPTAAQRAQMERLQIQLLQNSFKDFDLLLSSNSESVSGHPANYYKAAFSVQNEHGTTFNCISEAWTVFSDNITYSIGLSGSAANRTDYENDINLIFKSIKIV